MSTQPEALRIAAWLEETVPGVEVSPMETKAAAELRRLHEVNQELLAALRKIRGAENRRAMSAIADAAIAKATAPAVQRLPADDTEGGAA